MSVNTTPKPSPFPDAGRRGAAKRWGRRRSLRLDTLSEPVRAAIEALIAAEEAARVRAPGTRASREASHRGTHTATAPHMRRAGVDHAPE